MRRKNLKKYIINLVTFFTLITISAESFAALNYGSGRIRACNPDGSTKGLDWNPTTGGDDIEFVLSNPVCLSVIASVYGTTKVAIAAMNGACGTGSSVPRVTPSPWMDAKDLVRGIKKASKGGSRKCIAAAATAGIRFSSFLGEVSAVYGIARESFNNTKVCGHGWYAPNTTTNTFDAPGIKKQIKDKIDEYTRTNQIDKLNLTDPANKDYRQWYYDGVEYADNPDSG